MRARDLEESDLHIALDKIKRSDGHVSETTAKNIAGVDTLFCNLHLTSHGG